MRMNSNLSKTAVLLAAVMSLVCGAWADEVPEPVSDNLSEVARGLLCLLPVAGAWCLYRVMRRRS